MPEGRFRTRSVLIATGKGQRVFASPADVPADLRRPLEKALDSELAAAISIADEKGRAEALARLRQAAAPPPSPALPYARHAAIAGIAAFLLWVLATLR
jgi:hypothetical protein